MTAEDNHALLRLGEILREERKARGLRLIPLGKTASISESRLSLVENGKYPSLRLDDLERIMSALSLNEKRRAELRNLLDVAGLPANSMTVIGLRGIYRMQQEIAKDEEQSRRVRHYSAVLVPGLLQLPEYSRAVFAGMGIGASAVDGALVARQVRQHLLADSSREFRFVLAESVLYTSLGSVPTQKQQLAWLIMMSARPNIHLSVVPTTAGNVADASHGFSIFDQRAASAETMLDHVRTSRRDDVDYFVRVFEALEARAAHGEDGLDLVRRAELAAGDESPSVRDGVAARR